MVSVFASPVVDGVFEPRSDQTMNYNVDMCCFSVKPCCIKCNS